MASPPQDYSTLEAIVHAIPQHSTLEPLYYGSSHPPGGGGHISTYDHNDSLSAKEAYQAIETPPEGPPGKASMPKFMHRRICGMSMKMALVLGVILLLAVIGAAVGGAIAGTNSKKDKSAIPTPIPMPTLVSSPVSTTSQASSTSTTPTPTIICPNFDTREKEFLPSDKWLQIYAAYLGEDRYLKGAYQDGNGPVTVVSPEPATAKHDWNFMTLDMSPLGQNYGCKEFTVKRRLYHVACRSTEPQVGIRLALDTESWAAFNQTRDKNTLIRLRLAPNNSDDLSQLWFTEYRTETVDDRVYDWWDIFNYALGDSWRLGVSLDDPQPYMLNGGSNNTKLRTKEMEVLVKPWFGY